MRVFLWGPAIVVAMVYTTAATWLLVAVSNDADGESVTATWLVVGAPWIFSGLGQYYYLAAPLNGLTLYLLMVLGFAIYRAVLSE